jgi:hypothetical protein
MRLNWRFGRMPGIGLTGLLAALVLGLAGCGHEPSTDGLSSELRAAKDFPGYLVYYAGPEVKGFELNRVVEDGQEQHGRDRSRWIFGYGDCTPSGSEGGCPLPVEIQNYAICRRWPGAYPWKVPLFDFKGARLARRGGATVEIYTGRTAIAIFGSKQRAMAAARQLRIVGRQQPAEGFPPPLGGSLEGDLACQDKPG